MIENVSVFLDGFMSEFESLLQTAQTWYTHRTKVLPCNKHELYYGVVQCFSNGVTCTPRGTQGYYRGYLRENVLLLLNEKTQTNGCEHAAQ